MCQGRKLRRIICKSCSTPGRYSVIGMWDVFKKGFECKGGNSRCVVWDYKDEIESKHRCSSCIAKTMLGLKSASSGKGRDEYQYYYNPSPTTNNQQSWYGNHGNRSGFRYRSDASFS